jgi:enoyl-CoA hydratase
MESVNHYKNIKVQQEGRLIIIYLDSPPNNFIDIDLASSIKEICLKLSEEDICDIMILTADKDRHFSQGTDPMLFTELGDAKDIKDVQQMINRYRVASSIASLKFPVISALGGNCYGQGLEIALASDIRFGSTVSKFKMDQVSQGIIPWDGGTQRLSRTVGLARSMELILNCQEIESDEALAIGLLNSVVETNDLLSKAVEVAEQILLGGAIAARYAKEVVVKGTEMTLEQGILLETDLTMILQTTKDRTEGINSFIERRKPNYTGE